MTETEAGAGGALVRAILRQVVRAGDKLHLTCTAAHEIAEREGVPLEAVGEICQRENIRIKKCQLGCF